ncbi:PREDICTED: non-specific lipid-transfer protein 3 [Tarenaya hassleriana]|uniref:non-specific lipid-transfer protein 3 n=1 Tax=Tarenaya hassleriana TaxID=28532 RepID=UPI00053C13C2|nr:PREDICTED: non-specific lipid-transfer protein 3 [Tarenaya hassleriana]
MAFAVRFMACMVLAVCMAAATANAAISCGTVTSTLSPCVSYLTNGGSVTSQCCAGVKALNSAAQTTPDRQQACQCLKSAAQGISGLKPDLAQGLPGACGVSLPYPISYSTNCNNVQ